MLMADLIRLTTHKLHLMFENEPVNVNQWSKTAADNSSFHISGFNCHYKPGGLFQRTSSLILDEIFFSYAQEPHISQS